MSDGIHPGKREGSADLVWRGAGLGQTAAQVLRDQCGHPTARVAGGNVSETTCSFSPLGLSSARCLLLLSTRRAGQGMASTRASTSRLSLDDWEALAPLSLKQQQSAARVANLVARSISLPPHASPRRADLTRMISLTSPTRSCSNKSPIRVDRRLRRHLDSHSRRQRGAGTPPARDTTNKSLTRTTSWTPSSQGGSSPSRPRTSSTSGSRASKPPSTATRNPSTSTTSPTSERTSRAAETSSRHWTTRGPS